MQDLREPHPDNQNRHQMSCDFYRNTRANNCQAVNHQETVKYIKIHFVTKVKHSQSEIQILPWILICIFRGVGA